MKKERVLYLDMVRIIGFLAITAYHFMVTVEASGIISDHIDIYMGFNSFRWGPIALSCFFMVSGAALIYRYEEEFQLKEYYRKRFLGIYPLFWLAYFFAFLEHFYYVKSMPDAPKISFLLTVIGMDGYLMDFMNNFYLIGEWFLGAIIILYILFPLYRLVMRKNKYILPVIFLGIGFWLSYNDSFPMVFDKNPLVCSMYFVMGMLFEMLRKGSNQKAVIIGRRIAAAVGVGIYVIVYLTEKTEAHFNGYHRVFMLSVSFYVIIMEVSTWIKSERVQKLIAVIGRHSFSYFLIHHVFLLRYVAHFSGMTMSGSNTLLLFLTSVGYIYLLAVGLDKIYGRLAETFCRERLVTKSK